MRNLFRSLCVLFLSSATVVQAADPVQVHVAVAANFTGPLDSIVQGFERKTGYRIVSSPGATGTLYTQITNGAPFEVFLSADSARPQLLEKTGFAVNGSRFTYAIGKLVLWSTKPRYVGNGSEILKTGTFQHIAIADPKTAPYGAAAQEVMTHLGVWDSLQTKLVQGENITQAHQFVESGNAELGFVAMSQITEPAKDSYWVVPQNLYAPLEQQAVLLVKGKDNPAAAALLNYLKKDARPIIEQAGYSLP